MPGKVNFLWASTGICEFTYSRRAIQPLVQALSSSHLKGKPCLSFSQLFQLLQVTLEYGIPWTLPFELFRHSPDGDLMGTSLPSPLFKLGDGFSTPQQPLTLLRVLAASRPTLFNPTLLSFCYSFDLENLTLCIIILFCAPHFRDKVNIFKMFVLTNVLSFL